MTYWTTAKPNAEEPLNRGYWIVTTAVAELFPVFGSVSLAFTLAVLLVVPFLCGALT
jgi:hypothetical protein